MALDKRIYELPPKATVLGEMKLPIYDENSDTTYHVTVENLVPSTPTSSFEWNEFVVYNENDVVVQDDVLWVSQQDNNEGVLPGSDEDFWLPGLKGKSGLVPWVASIFTDQYVTVIRNNRIMYLVNATRPYNSTDIEAEILAGDWIQLNKVQLVEFDTTGAIAIDFFGLQELCLQESDPITAPKTWSFLNASGDPLLVPFIRFSISGGLHVQTLPAGSKLANSTNALWDPGTREWEPLSEGEYEARVTSDGTQFNWIIQGPY